MAVGPRLASPPQTLGALASECRRLFSSNNHVKTTYNNPREQVDEKGKHFLFSGARFWTADMDRMTATEVLLETYPSMEEDKELMPLMRRMMIIEKLLATNIAKTNDPSTTRQQLAEIHAHQDVLLAQVQQINSQIERIGNMRRSLAILERGAARLRIRRQ